MSQEWTEPYQDPDRKTGRTTRMLNEAIEEAFAGKDVLVLGATAAFAEVMASHVAIRYPYDRRGQTRFKLGKGTLEFRSAQGLESLGRALRGTRKVLMVDHAVWDVLSPRQITDLHHITAMNERL